MVKVRFLVKHRQYSKGDEAAVTDAVAEALLRHGIAEKVKIERARRKPKERAVADAQK